MFLIDYSSKLLLTLSGGSEVYANVIALFFTLFSIGVVVYYNKILNNKNQKTPYWYQAFLQKISNYNYFLRVTIMTIVLLPVLLFLIFSASYLLSNFVLFVDDWATSNAIFSSSNPFVKMSMFVIEICLIITGFFLLNKIVDNTYKRFFKQHLDGDSLGKSIYVLIPYFLWVVMALTVGKIVLLQEEDFIQIGHKFFIISIEVFLTVLATGLVYNALDKLFVELLGKFVKRPFQKSVVNSAHKPLMFLIWALGLSFAIDIINAEIKISALSFTHLARDAFMYLVGLVFIVKLLKNVESEMVKSIKKDSKTRMDATTFRAIMRLLRLVVILVVVLTVLENTNFIEIKSILAISGLGAASIAFASKDLLI